MGPFQKTYVKETGLSAYRKLITTFFKNNFSLEMQEF